MQIAADVCSDCHASERLNTKYNLPPDRVKTFFESYHGLAAQYGSTLAANCASCHGVHNILPLHRPALQHLQDQPGRDLRQVPSGRDRELRRRARSTWTPRRPQAAGDVGGKINWWVRRIYLVLIVGTIGFMLAHNLLLFSKKVRARYRAADLSVLRMSLSQRTQHVILAVELHRAGRDGLCLEVPRFVDRQGHGVQ